MQMERALVEMENEQRSKLLCPPHVQNFAKEIVVEFLIEMVSHGSAVSVPSMQSEEYRKFRELMEKKKMRVA
jgi:hypothetical protein